ncbi:MAG: hypothetical protein K2X53_03685, partial [Alphaproteobacteria bacterium]|nr:hypothetical protein [Alphaproteobacteria bacterium]
MIVINKIFWAFFLFNAFNLYPISSENLEEKYYSAIDASLNSKDVQGLFDLSEEFKRLPSDKQRSFVRRVYKLDLDSKIEGELMFDWGEYFHEQSLLIEKIVLFMDYLVNHATDPLERQNRERVKNIFVDSGGECNGLSTFWVYSKRLSDEPNERNVERDDSHFFNRVYKKFIFWDGKSELHPNDIQDMERFVGHVRFFQMGLQSEENPYYTEPFLNEEKKWEDAPILFSKEYDRDMDRQGRLELTLEDTKRGTPHLLFSSGYVFLTQKMLREKLDLLVKPKKMITIGVRSHRSSADSPSKAHAMAIYQSSAGEIFFYDPISSDGEVIVGDRDKLATLLWDKAGLGLYGGPWFSMDFKNIAFDVFDFDPDNTYPSAKDFASIGDINIKEMRTPHLFNGAARSDGFGNDQSSVLNRLSDDQIVTLLRELTGDNKKNLIIWAANKKPEISPELARSCA